MQKAYVISRYQQFTCNISTSSKKFHRRDILYSIVYLPITNAFMIDVDIVQKNNEIDYVVEMTSS